MHRIPIVHSQIDISFKCLAFTFRHLTPANLEVELDIESFHDRINAIFVRGRLEDTGHRIKGEPENVAIVLRCLTYLPDPENGRDSP